MLLTSKRTFRLRKRPGTLRTSTSSFMRCLNENRAEAFSRSIALKIWSNLLYFREIRGLIPDPHLTQVSKIGHFQSVAAAWSGMHGQTPTVRPPGRQRLLNKPQLCFTNSRTHRGIPFTHRNRRVRKLDRRHFINHSRENQPGRCRLARLKTRGDRERRIDRDHVHSEIRPTFIRPAHRAAQAPPFPSIFAGKRRIGWIDPGVLHDQDSVFHNGRHRRCIFPFDRWRPDPVVLGAEPEAMATSVQTRIIGQHPKLRSIEKIDQSIVRPEINQT